MDFRRSSGVSESSLPVDEVVSANKSAPLTKVRNALKLRTISWSMSRSRRSDECAPRSLGTTLSTQQARRRAAGATMPAPAADTRASQETTQARLPKV